MPARRRNALSLAAALPLAATFGRRAHAAPLLTTDTLGHTVT